jgi:hypothetical protein
MLTNRRHSRIVRGLHGAITMEILVTLAITAMLMLSTAAATKSACQNMAANEGQFTGTRTNRQMAQAISRAVRCATACDIGTGAAAGATKNGIILYVTPAGGGTTAYVYDIVNGQLLLDTQPTLPATDSPNIADIRSRMLGTSCSVVVLASNVTSLSFIGKYANRPDPSDPSVQDPTLVNLQINMEVTQNGQMSRACESVVPRRTQQ